MNISELQKTSAKSYVGDRLYFHNNYGFMIVGFHENWKEIFWLDEEKEHGYFYLVSAPYDDDGNINFDKKQDVGEWYGIHEFQKGPVENMDRKPNIKNIKIVAYGKSKKKFNCFFINIYHRVIINHFIGAIFEI